MGQAVVLHDTAMPCLRVSLHPSERCGLCNTSLELQRHRIRDSLDHVGYCNKQSLVQIDAVRGTISTLLGLSPCDIEDKTKGTATAQTSTRWMTWGCRRLRFESIV